MEFPYVVKENLSKEEIELWGNVYECADQDRNRSLEEGLWRRTQSRENKNLSGWQSLRDKRRRLIHYFYQYGLSGEESGKRNLVLKNFYLWIFYSLPENEDLFKMVDLDNKLEETSWQVLSKNKHNLILEDGELYLHIHKKASEISGYFDYEFIFRSDKFVASEELKNRPWVVLKTGIRKKGKQLDEASLFRFKYLKDLLPAQVEIGCGPSIENGIQPLHYLHDVYSVSKDFRTKEFVLDPREDTILNGMLFDYKKMFPVLTSMFKRSFETKPDKFYQYLKKMYEEGFFVGDLINNNFDLLPSKLGIKEKFIRKFDEQHILPRIEFHKDAKALFVFGLHADRRKVQAAARDQGLVVVYVDTEGFYIDDVFYEYPLEGLTKDDILYREQASVAIEQIFNFLKK